MSQENKCDLCRTDRHHFTEHLENIPLEELTPGKVVFVRAVITERNIEAWSTSVQVQGYQPLYPSGQNWDATVNSVDIFPCESGGKSKWIKSRM
mgnify:CR=1 FL=1